MKTHSRWLLASLTFTMFFGSPATTHAGDADKGKIVYEARCAFCHGMTGKGDGIAGSSLQPPPRNFTTADYWKTATVDQMRDAIENGKPGTAMVAFKATLKPGEADDLVAYIGNFKPK